MKNSKFSMIVITLLTIIFTSSCKEKYKENTIATSQLIGTWKLLTGTIIKGQDTTITDYTINQEFIKIINETHFAFLRHDLGEDSIAVFVSGGGSYKIENNKYIEHLDYCNYRPWENNIFEFEYEITGDSLTTTGIEKIESLNVNHLNIEKYVRIK